MSELKRAREALAEDDLAVLKASVSAEPALARDWRLIMDAALYRRAEFIEALVAAGADPNAASRSEARYRPLHRAIEPKPSLKRRGDLGTAIDILLAAGADPLACGCWYEGRAVETAARAGDRASAEQILSRRPSDDIVTAVLMGDAPLLERELRRDAGSAARPDDGGAEPLHRLCASLLNSDVAVRMAEALIAAGASPNARTSMKHAQLPVLHFACFGGSADPELLRLLVAAGAQPDDGLYEALWSGDFAAAGVLLELGASVDSWSHVSERPMLSEMIQWGRNPAALWLLERGADPGQPDSAGRTPLDFAGSRGAPPNVMAALAGAGSA